MKKALASAASKHTSRSFFGSLVGCSLFRSVLSVFGVTASLRVRFPSESLWFSVGYCVRNKLFKEAEHVPA